MNSKFRILLILLLSTIFVNSAQASWIADSDFKDGITGGVGWPSSVIEYNITGDDNWTLIYGDMFGNNYGFYWNGTSWVPDQNKVLGITNHNSLFVYSSTSLGYNVTGNESWEMIFGYGSGTFVGYYWNGSSWVGDSDIVSGLADVGDRASPTMAYNVTGNDNWVLLAGESKLEGDTEIVGYQFESGSWTTYNDITVGLPNVEHITTPHFVHNLTGNDNWNLIICDDAGAAFGYYWSGSSWISDSSIISGLSSIGSYPDVVTNYDIRSDDKWTLISGNADNEFFAYYFNVLPVTSFVQTESKTNPTEISTNASNPYFSWTYTDTNSDTQQSYEIYVGTTSGASDLWNVQISSSNPYATYAGTTLEEITTYYIQVRTNDGYENSDWVTGTFALKDTTAYSPPPTGGDSSSLDIYSEKISTPVIITEKITDTFAETDSLTFILYLIGALLGALIFGIISNNDNMINVILTGVVGWVLTLVAMILNNLLEFIIIDSITTMIISVIFGFTTYLIYDQYPKDKTTTKRRPKK